MADGKFLIGKPAGGVTTVSMTDGASNTDLVLPESGTVATTADVNNSAVLLKTIATGTATFDAVTNAVTFSGLSVQEIENFAQVERGDVLQYSNATDTKNNSEFTVEVLTQKWANGVAITEGQQRKSVTTNITYTALTSGTTSGTDVANDIGVSWEIATSETIIVNQAHAGKGTTKNVAARASDTGVTIKLLAKWYNASRELGRDWVNVTDSRIAGTSYLNNTKRGFCISVCATNMSSAGACSIILTVAGLDQVYGFPGASLPSGNAYVTAYKKVPSGSSYSFTLISLTSSSFFELR